MLVDAEIGDCRFELQGSRDRERAGADVGLYADIVGVGHIKESWNCVMGKESLSERIVRITEWIVKVIVGAPSSERPD
jgi:hypothetical protein